MDVDGPCAPGVAIPPDVPKQRISGEHASTVLEQILTGTDACLTKQYQALIETEGVKLEFAGDGIKRLVVGILLPAIAVGPNATRVGALGVTQA